MIKRKKTIRITIGNVSIGDGAPIAVQSMTNTDPRDIDSTLRQIQRLHNAGCEIVRLAIPDKESARALKEIKRGSEIPVIADIHFDYRLALAALEAGADGLRINPGNIGGRQCVDKVVKAAAERQVPIRIGVNSGSIEKDLLVKYGGPTPQAMVESVLRHVAYFENLNFHLIKISLKSSSVMDTIAAYELISDKTQYPLHLGVTEAGTLISGTVKSAVAMGHLLIQGIGDTIRVSLTRDPVEEVKVAYEILRSLGLRHRGPEIISCPTCGRCEIDLFKIVEKVEDALSTMVDSPKIAIMGCVVNGPGEAKEADIGVAGGRGQGILFKKGNVIKKIKEEDLAEVLIRETRELVREFRFLKEGQISK